MTVCLSVCLSVPYCHVGARPERKYMYGDSQAMTAGRLTYRTACQSKECMVVDQIDLVTRSRERRM